jgi:hypothetical protein
MQRPRARTTNVRADPSKTIPSWLTARDSKKVEKREESYEDKTVVGGQSKSEPA